MHRSYFSYNLTRSYPFRWFTSVVVIGGIIITIAITVLSVATSGYELISISTSDPNATETSSTWLGQRISTLTGGMQASCASVTIPPDTIFWTNNTAFAHILSEVITQDSEKNTQHQGSLIYHSNPLHDCSVTFVSINFKAMQRAASSIAYQQQGAKANAGIECQSDTPLGRTNVSLLAAYDLAPDAGDTSRDTTQSFGGRNAPEKGSLFWGESLLYMHWVSLTNS